MQNIIAHAAASQAKKSGLLDLKKGFAMLRSRDVSVTLKLGSLAVGVLSTILLALVEAPIEGLVGFLLPLIGPAIDLAIDGAEIVLLPLLIAAALLPHLVERRSRRI
jgi:hypothetical protein